jgi:hypothetical protein
MGVHTTVMEGLGIDHSEAEGGFVGDRSGLLAVPGGSSQKRAAESELYVAIKLGEERPADGRTMPRHAWSKSE